MFRFARLLVVALLVAALSGALAGCASNNAPLFTIGSPSPRPAPSEIPAGPEHQVCRDCAINLQRQLDDCQKQKKKAEADRDKYKSERDQYKKQLEKLGG